MPISKPTGYQACDIIASMIMDAFRCSVFVEFHPTDWTGSVVFNQAGTKYIIEVLDLGRGLRCHLERHPITTTAIATSAVVGDLKDNLNRFVNKVVEVIRKMTARNGARVASV